MRLRPVYVRLNILKKVSSIQRVTLEELEQLYNRDQRRFERVHDAVDAEGVVDEIQKLIVLGKPGSGKTTLLKRLALAALDGDLKKKVIPVFISLKDWVDSRGSLTKYIVNEFELCGLPSPQLFVHHLLEQGHCLLLLDGFDEVTGDLQEAIHQLLNFTVQYRQNQYVMTCRIAAYTYVFQDFTDVEVADFDPEQVEAFVDNWFSAEPQKAHLCKQQLRDHAPIAELSSIPLLLTLLCLAFGETLDFPTNKAELYGEAVDALLKKWDSSRAIRREELYRYLSVKRKEQMLGKVAYETFREGQYFFKQGRLQQLIGAYIENLTDANVESLDIDSEAVVKAIEVQHGLFVERAKGIYSLSHLTLQEFFVAAYVVQNEARGLVDSLLGMELLDQRLREVIVLTASLMPQADRLLLAVRRSVSALGRSELVDFLFSSLPTGPRSAESSLPGHIYRTAALYDVLRRLSVHSNQEALANRMLEDAKQLIELLDDPRCAIRETQSGQYKSWKEIDPRVTSEIALDLNRALIREREELVVAVRKYLAGTILFINCMRTQCYVSREVREKLISSVLSEPYKELA